MDAHDRRKLDHFKDFRFRGASFQSVLDVAAYTRPMQVGRGHIDRNEDHFLVFLLQRAVQRHRAEMQERFQIVRCIDPVESAQVKPPRRMPRRGFSCPAPDEGADGCKS